MGPSCDRAGALKRRGRGSRTLFVAMRTQRTGQLKIPWKVTVCKPGRELLPGTEMTGIFVLDFPASNTAKDKCCCLNHPVFRISLWRPELTDTFSKDNSLSALAGVNSPAVTSRTVIPGDSGKPTEAAHSSKYQGALSWSHVSPSYTSL